MIADVKSEEAWHARFEAGLASWRTLHTQHAVRLFNTRLAGELAEPERCLAIFKDLTRDQAAAYQVGRTPVVTTVVLTWAAISFSSRQQPEQCAIKNVVGMDQTVGLGNHRPCFFTTILTFRIYVLSYLVFKKCYPYSGMARLALLCNDCRVWLLIWQVLLSLLRQQHQLQQRKSGSRQLMR